MTTEQLIQAIAEAGYQIHVGYHLGEINVALSTSPLCVDVDSYGETLHEALTKAHAAVLAMVDYE